MRKYLPHLFFAVFFLLFALKGITVLDPDLGWHLKMGELILRHGIPKTDPFSYTMPSYPFVDHEWFTDIVLYLLYTFTGMIGPALLFAGLATAALALIFYRKAGGWNLLYAAALFSVLFPFAGVRPQVIGWFFVPVFLLLLVRKRGRWLLPVLTLVWVNIHGSFFLGVFIVALFVAVAALRKRSVTNLLLLALVVGVTFLNPYGGRIWVEVYMSLSDPALRFFISEWMPAVFFANFVYWLYTVFAGVVVFKYRRHISLYQQLLFWVFLLAGLSSMRNIPLFILVSVCPVKAGLEAFLEEASRTGERRRRLQYVAVRMNAVAIIVVLLQLSLLFFGSLDTIQYPEKAVSYIKSHRLKGNILAIYGWGGYLIWNLPGRKVFIDGRMPSWRWSNPPAGESDNARRDYGRFFESAKLMRKIGNKYQVKYVLVRPVPKRTDWENWIARIFSLKPAKPTPVEGLPVIYDDGVAAIRLFK